MKDHDFGSMHERPTAEQVEYFAREMRARAWSLHVFSPLRRLVRRLAARLIAPATNPGAVAEESLPETSARR